MTSARPTLPFIDEHARVVAAPPERAWGALTRVMSRATASPAIEGYARLVRCEPATRAGSLPDAGATIAAFRVERADAPSELALEGRHRFATYTLVFRLSPYDDGRATWVRAETRAEFPGAAGAAYRLAVIHSGGHALAMRHILRRVATVAERVG